MNKETHNNVARALKNISSKDRAESAKWFFKTAPGEYGYGDIFIGVTVPNQRKVAKEFKNLPMVEILKLLKSRIHEHRLTALFILVAQFARADEKTRGKIVQSYLRHTAYVNNWDLVDSSAHKILGEYLVDKDRAVLYKLARSKKLWERRIAIVATAAFIGRNDFSDTLKISEMLLEDRHDLIHKATGWMLREVGKRSLGILENFLDIHKGHMPRTMLRYAIERFPQEIRQGYLRRN